MKKSIMVLCLSMLTGCGLCGEAKLAETVKTISVKTGAMDNLYADNDTAITVVADKLAYKNNGQCKDNKQTVDCMWWGLQLQYPAASTATVLQCDTVKVINAEPENPRSLFPPSSLNYRWKIELPANTTAKSLVYFALPGKGELTLQTHCIAAGVKPVDFSMTIRF